MDSIIDFRTIEQNYQHALFFSLVEGMKSGASFEFINDQDPSLLLDQFNLMNLDDTQWTYTEKGPLGWRVRITKKNHPSKKETSCCGICGGHNK